MYIINEINTNNITKIMVLKGSNRFRLAFSSDKEAKEALKALTKSQYRELNNNQLYFGTKVDRDYAFEIIKDYFNN